MLNTMSSGRMTSPGEIVENFGKNCSIAIPAKKLQVTFINGMKKQHTFEKSEVKDNVHISNSSKLFQQIPRQECDNGVLGCDDLVRTIYVLLLGTLSLVEIISGEVSVDEDRAGWTWGSFLVK
jgi:hypothetical protein